jgi:hypothetical protein
MHDIRGLLLDRSENKKERYSFDHTILAMRGFQQPLQYSSEPPCLVAKEINPPMTRPRPRQAPTSILQSHGAGLNRAEI